MSKMIYENFIKENVPPYNTKKIAVYENGKKIKYIYIPDNMQLTNTNKLYSFGVISDIHLQSDTAPSDFIKAMNYFNSEGTSFVCICGDLTAEGTGTQLTEYKNYVDTYSKGLPVYAITGNHEAWRGADLESVIQQFTGNPLYYSFTQGNDVFIMLGVCGDKSGHAEGGLFTKAELQFMYDTLEANRNKRCFVFHHVRPQDGCGNAYGIYNLDIWGGTEATVFENLMKHYKNAHQFHGHSHLKFNLQTKYNMANIDNLFGGYSIHVPSLSVPRTGDPSGASSRVEVYSNSEGYVVDVYSNYIVLKGRDFVNDKWLPIATYKLDTTLVTIPPKTFVDNTGTITV